VPIIAVFALKRNCFMKPHTKMWTLIKKYYKMECKENMGQVKEAVLISSRGGYSEEIFDKKLDRIVHKKISDDVDLAFAHNIGVRFINIDHFFDMVSNPKAPQWNSEIIAPEFRKEYIEQLALHENEDIFRIWMSLPRTDNYMIMIMGSPTSGKTTLAKEIMTRCAKSKWGEKNKLMYLNNTDNTLTRLKKLTKKYISERCSILLDGEFPNEHYRGDLIDIAIQNNMSYLIINVNPGLEIARLLNHVRIETCGDLDELTPKSKYIEYRGRYIKPVVSSSHGAYLVYKPKIIVSDILMNYRF
jgi:hypothetical protein